MIKVLILFQQMIECASSFGPWSILLSKAEFGKKDSRSGNFFISIFCNAVRIVYFNLAVSSYFNCLAQIIAPSKHSERGMTAVG